MTELKTFKDIVKQLSKEGHGSVGELLNYGRFRNEAIKWIKFIREDKSHYEQQEKEYGVTEHLDDYWRGQVNWIINFFNLTEEDLI